MAQGVPIPICTSIDTSVGMATHDVLFVAPPAPPAPCPGSPAFELIAPFYWPPGAGSSKCTHSVFDLGSFAVILEGHDCGMMLPHLTVPLNNGLLPLTILMSKREVKFQSFYNRMDRKQVALAGAMSQMPLMSCGEPLSMPGTFPLTSSLNHETVGMTVADFVGGWLNAVVSIAGSFLEAQIFPKVGQVGQLDGLWSKDSKSLYSAMLGALNGGVTSLAQHLLDANYPVRVPLDYTTGGVTFKAEVTFGSADTTNNPSSVSGTVAVSSPKATEAAEKVGEKMFGTFRAQATVRAVVDAGANSADEVGVKTSASVENQGVLRGFSNELEAAWRPERTDDLGRDESVTVTTRETIRVPNLHESASHTYVPPDGWRESSATRSVTSPAVYPFGSPL